MLAIGRGGRGRVVDMSLPARVILTAGFVATGLFCVHRCVGRATSSTWAARVDYGVHALMSGSMIAMAWASSPFASWQTAVFTLAVCWFLLRATGPSLSPASHRVTAVCTGPPPAAGGCATRHPAGAVLRCVHHAVVMAAMAWTVYVMSAGSRTMPGMVMHGMSSSGTPSAGTRYVAAVGAGYFLLVAALIAAGTRVRRPAASGHGGVAGDVNHALMTAGMAIMLLAML